MFKIAENNQEIVRQTLDEFGFERSSDINNFVYEDVCKRIGQLVEERETNEKVDMETGEIQEDDRITLVDFENVEGDMPF